MNAKELICEHIRNQGNLLFVEFMQQALYTPNYGYYSSARQKFGVDGDFVTAPELTPLFGQTIAQQCAEWMSQIQQPHIFEFGAGSGALCVTMLTELAHRQQLPEAYHILEVSGHLRQQQLAHIEQHIPQWRDRIIWHESWPDQPFQGIVIANEVLDAMPVHRFLCTEQTILESYITLNERGELQEIFDDCHNPGLLSAVRNVLPQTTVAYQSEVNMLLDDWLLQCAQMLHKGVMLIIDYGFPAHEYYHPDRHMGTLMCHHRHQTHPNPLIHVGEQDITAHVNFTQVATAADKAGFQIAGYTNQASFLLASGLLSILAAHQQTHPDHGPQHAIKQLLQPQEMGELFKVMALTKAMDLPLSGFQLSDKRASL